MMLTRNRHLSEQVSFYNYQPLINLNLLTQWQQQIEHIAFQIKIFNSSAMIYVFFAVSLHLRYNLIHYLCSLHCHKDRCCVENVQVRFWMQPIRSHTLEMANSVLDSSLKLHFPIGLLKYLHQCHSITGSL